MSITRSTLFQSIIIDKKIIVGRPQSLLLCFDLSCVAPGLTFAGRPGYVYLEVHITKHFVSRYDLYFLARDLGSIPV
jgi:hypothetical protein